METHTVKLYFGIFSSVFKFLMGSQVSFKASTMFCSVTRVTCAASQSFGRGHMTSVVTYGKPKLSECGKMVVGVVADRRPWQQKRQKRGPTESLLNIPMMRMSKPWTLWSMKADTSKCLVFLRGVMVASAIEEGHAGGGPCGIGMDLFTLGILRVRMNTVVKIQVKTPKCFHLTLLLSIQPKRR